jgi:hypothetical protein
LIRQKKPKAPAKKGAAPVEAAPRGDFTAPTSRPGRSRPLRQNMGLGRITSKPPRWTWPPRKSRSISTATRTARTRRP